MRVPHRQITVRRMMVAVLVAGVVGLALIPTFEAQG
jgi:hypothetical protein